MLLEILSPENQIFEGEISSIIFPGSNGKFQVLKNHAPIISFLIEGNISYVTNNKNKILSISSGVVEVFENKICALIETNSK